MEFIYHFIYHVIEYWILNTRISTAGAQSKTVDLTENSMSSCARRWRFGRRRRSAVVLRLHRHGCFSWIWTIWKAERNVRTKRAQLLYMSSILYTYMIIYVYIYMYIEVFFLIFPCCGWNRWTSAGWEWQAPLFHAEFLIDAGPQEAVVLCIELHIARVTKVFDLVYMNKNIWENPWRSTNNSNRWVVEWTWINFLYIFVNVQQVFNAVAAKRREVWKLWELSWFGF